MGANYCPNCGAKSPVSEKEWLEACEKYGLRTKNLRESPDLSAYGIAKGQDGGVGGSLYETLIGRNPLAGFIKGLTWESKCPKCGEDL